MLLRLQIFDVRRDDRDQVEGMKIDWLLSLKHYWHYQSRYAMHLLAG